MTIIHEIDYNRPIRHYFENEERTFVCLFPFYRKVFADHYNWEANLKYTYPLIETLTWKEVSKKVGFNNLNWIAQGILELNETFKTELNEFCEQEKIEFPSFAEDKIPEVVLIPILEYLIKQNHSDLEIKPFERFPISSTRRIPLQKRELFDIFEKVGEAKFLKTENSITLLLPDYDCFYILITGEENACKELIVQAKLETLVVDEKMTFQWWND